MFCDHTWQYLHKAFILAESENKKCARNKYNKKEIRDYKKHKDNKNKNNKNDSRKKMNKKKITEKYK